MIESALAATARPFALARRIAVGVMILLGAVAGPAFADGSRIVATGGASSIDGAAGGGLVPWASISGYGEEREYGATAFATGANLQDFSFGTIGASASFQNRLELSAAKQRLDIDSIVPGEKLDQSVFGAKLRLGGELVWSAMPQLSVGVQLKRVEDFDVPEAVGAARATGVDFYLAASKLWLVGPFDRTLFVNATLRLTSANQNGLLGFGTPGDLGHEPVLEGSAGLFLNRHWVIGAEYRQKPDKLAFAREDDWFDAFVGWFPNKHLAFVAAWADLGSIAGLDGQTGGYLSAQWSY